MSNYRLTVVIATRNREYYCIKAIESILSINSEYIQISVSDNSDSLIISDYLEENPNNRVVYKYNPKPMSFVHNFNEAMKLAEGEYVCLIGDDDSVLPNIVELVDWARENSVETVTAINTITYYWPNANPDYISGMVEVPLVSPGMQLVNARAELELLLKNGIVNYLLYPLPKTYHGIVKRELMCEIYRVTGAYYGGLSPDIYSAIALSCLTKKHYSTNVPFSIAGACAKSATVESIRGKHCGELKDMPHLKNRGPYIWDKNVPEYFSVPTIWADSGLKALQELKENDLYNQFNKYTLSAQGIIQNRKTILGIVLRETVLFRKRIRKSRIVFWMMMFFGFINLIFAKIKRSSNVIVKTKVLVGVPEIKDAVRYANDLSHFN